MGKLRQFFSLTEPEKFNADLLGDSKESSETNVNNEIKYVSEFIDQNEKYILEVLKNCYDLTIRKVALFDQMEYKAMLVYLDVFTKSEMIDRAISKLVSTRMKEFKISEIENDIKYTMGINDKNIYDKFDKCIDAILSGKVVVFVDMINKAFVLELKNPPSRAVEEPSVETAMRGPREGFTETINININLIRRKLKNSNLKVEKMTLGKETNTDVAICYMENYVNKKVLEELKTRINKIELNRINSSNSILEAVEDDGISLVPTIFRTERPDVAISKIQEGKVLLIVDGSPVALSVPALFVEFMQTADDYILKYIPVSLNRWFRYIGLIMSILLPSIYVALISFQQELIPTPLAISVIRSRSGVPLPAVWECFLMLSAYDIIREAGLRVPKPLGGTVSIVGALILGESAVRAGIVSAPVIIIVAFSGIALFAVPSPELVTSLVLIKYFFLLLASFLGVFGIIDGILVLSIYMISRRSFGVPYMYPIAPTNLKRNKDTIIRVPTWMQDKNYKIFKK